MGRKNNNETELKKRDPYALPAKMRRAGPFADTKSKYPTRFEDEDDEVDILVKVQIFPLDFCPPEEALRELSRLGAQQVEEQENGAFRALVPDDAIPILEQIAEVTTRNG